MFKHLPWTIEPYGKVKSLHFLESFLRRGFAGGMAKSRENGQKTTLRSEQT